MKIDLKKISYILTFAVFMFSACNESEDIITEDAQTGGLLDGSKISLNYVVGNSAGPYTAEFFVNQGRQQTKEVKLYKSFTTTIKYTETVEGEEVEKSKTFVSNEVLDKTLTISNDKNHYITTDWSLESLIQGLEVSNLAGEVKALPNDDQQYSVGDRWIFRVVSVLADGREVQQAYNVNVTVSTRFAGTYRVVDALYYRIGDLNTDESGWPETVTIESVDATTYRANAFGLFDDGEIFFNVDLATFAISYPAKKFGTTTDQGYLTYDFITCADDLGEFDELKDDCAVSNIAVKVDPSGADRLIMVYGYVNHDPAAAGPREFYQVLEKIVD